VAVVDANGKFRRSIELEKAEARIAENTAEWGVPGKRLRLLRKELLSDKAKLPANVEARAMCGAFRGHPDAEPMSEELTQYILSRSAYGWIER
jgi:hypothetical protein